MKRNKVRYQVKPKKKVIITLSGNVYLQYRDDEVIETAVKGDLMVYPKCEALHTQRVGEYEGLGFSGYFKVDIHDGKQWCLVLVQELFPENQHHFAKNERPIDTYGLIEDLLKAMAGTALQRTYREHYGLADED